ncbi:hypothetical protein BC938DRAFT_470960 [Jimgerdemannia flammicorona]|uniref:MABP domain-containing protein n=1 Tax=Jimgerdemannia flammicorona TaxID=994334 RepID=A0A433Q995_9FUNG|nr:hypothetical protein BC938DRAFT_470960 [Jimgerdemannia flammicorona]
MPINVELQEGFERISAAIEHATNAVTNIFVSASFAVRLWCFGTGRWVLAAAFWSFMILQLLQQQQPMTGEPTPIQRQPTVGKPAPMQQQPMASEPTPRQQSMEVPFLVRRRLMWRITRFKVTAQNHDGPPSNENDLLWHPQDLNEGHDGKYVYVGVRWESRGDPVTSLDFLIQDNEGPRIPHGWTSDYTDLNTGVGGKYIYLIWRTGEAGERPITAIAFRSSKGSNPPDIHGFTAVHKDLCSRAGGSYMWGYYHRGLADKHRVLG